jgi:ArsR family metal-binding transcriptional regulator
MNTNNEVRLQQIGEILNGMVKIGSHFDDIYEAFLIYDKYKGILDIEVYEKSLEMYQSGLVAMDEQIRNFYEMMNALSDILNS